MDQTSPYEVGNQLRIERDIAIDKLNRAKAEVSRLTAENKSLKEKVDELEVTLDDEECGNIDTFEAWKFQKNQIATLRSALGLIHAIATDLCRSDGSDPFFAFVACLAMVNIRDKATAAIEATATHVTDDGEAD